MNIKKTSVLGMELDACSHESCVALVYDGGEDWATIYIIESQNPGQGHATELLAQMKDYYNERGKKLSSSVALNTRMRYLLNQLNIPEHE